MLKIWGRKNSSNVQKVLFTCAELGVPFERIDWAGPFGGNDDPAYRKLNPNGVVPAVEDGGLVIWESNTICRYLCATRNGAHLHPTDPAARTFVDRWMDWQLANAAGPTATIMIGMYRTPEPKRDMAAIGAAEKRLGQIWTIVDTWLDGRTYLAGDSFTLADEIISIMAHRFLNFPIARPDLPRLRTWYDRVAARPAFVEHCAGPLT